MSSNTKIFKMWSLYPFISRDISVWAKEGDEEALKKVITENAGDLVAKGPYLIDSFQKDGKVSYAFRIVFQSYERTLTDEEINAIMNRVTEALKKEPTWQVR